MHITYVHVYCIHTAATTVNVPWAITPPGMTIININYTDLKDSLPNHNPYSTNLDDSVVIATPVSQRSGSFTDQETS